MYNGLTKLTSRRKWLVPNFVVWGLPGLGDIEYLNVEEVDGTDSILFGTVTIGNSAQQVTFSNLTDVRGNYLPSNINRPLVTIRSQSEAQAFLIGTETWNGFKIARDPAATGPIAVDLIVTELGE